MTSFLRSALWQCLLIAFGVSLFFHLVQFDTHLNWGDEGFLWYGVQRTLLGEVPLRDFQSYDPLRYYWSALFTPLFGGGLFGLRWASWLFQALALTLGLLALRRSVKTSAGLVLAAIVVVVWQFWRFRYFDASYMMVGVFFAVRLIEAPTRRNHLAAGVLTGVSALLGVNHGLYLFCAFMAIMLYSEAKKAVPASRRTQLAYFGGLAVGSVPLAGMMLVPGFWEKYIERVSWYAHNLMRGKTDIRAEIVWPWQVDWGAVAQNPAGFWTGFLHYANQWAQGATFMTLIAFYLAALWVVARLKKEDLAPNALFVACFFIGGFYLNHVFGRSDVTHLGEGMFPLFAGCAASAWARPAWRRAMVDWLLLLTVAAALPLSILFFKAMVPPDSMALYKVGKDRVWMFKRDAWQVHRLKEIVAKHVPRDEPLFIAPMLTSLYCVLERKSPTHQVYFMIDEPMPIQRRAIDDLERNRVNWAIVGDVALDGRPELAFSNTHPLLADHLFEEFEPVPETGLPAGHLLLRRRAD